jgi:hypothetical protein
MAHAAASLALTNGRGRLLGDAEDVFYLEYDQLRWYVANPKTAVNPDGYDKGRVRQAWRAREAAWQVRRAIGWHRHPGSLYEEPQQKVGLSGLVLHAAEKAAEPRRHSGPRRSPGLTEGSARVVRGFED